MFGLGAPELLVLVGLSLLLFGNKLPGVARSLGRAVSEFRHEAMALTEEATCPSGRAG
ncbi:MAG: twin-arginine translocase TatA/TatE family subunit [Gemmataceae bacterium]